MTASNSLNLHLTTLINSVIRIFTLRSLTLRKVADHRTNTLCGTVVRKTHTKQFREDLSNRITQHPTTANTEREEKSEKAKIVMISVLYPSVWANGAIINKNAGKAGQEGVQCS